MPDNPNPNDPAAGYPPHLKHLAPSDADLDMVMEEATGKPVDKGTAAANVRALRERIAQLEGQMLAVADLQRLTGVGNPSPPYPMLAELGADLARARALLAGYESQLGKLN